ncbi:XF1762 family protein [Microbacterium sp. NPDC055502]
MCRSRVVERGRSMPRARTAAEHLQGDGPAILLGLTRWRCVGVSEQPSVRLMVVPISLADANAFVESHHRHHKKVVGHKFSIGVVDESGEMRGVAIVGRPVSRHRDDGLTLEVTRLATDGCANAPSSLYSAAWRAGRAMGYRRIGTYTLATEPGTSLRAAGWRIVHEVRGASWNRDGRPRTDKHPTVDKRLWEPDLQRRSSSSRSIGARRSL